MPAVEGLDPVLRPFSLYEHAVRNRDVRQSAQEFLALANGYPNSALAEPALITVPRILLQTKGNLDALEKEPPKPLDPADLTEANTALTKLERRYPHSRFIADAFGWQGRIRYMDGDYVGALKLYRKQFDATSLQSAVYKPLQSIILAEGRLGRTAEVAAEYLKRYSYTTNLNLKFGTISQLTDKFAAFGAADGKAFWNLIKNEPRLLTYYVDYRVDIGGNLSDLLTLAEKNDRAVLRSPYKARFLARIAEVAYLTGRKSVAMRYAQLALNSRPSEEAAARAEFILGSVARRTVRYKTAVKCFETIVNQYPKSYLRGGARENLALLYEREGRLADALDEYRVLGYQYDFAYMLDIRMTPDEIAQYIAARPHHKDRDDLVYCLGLRYLRKHDWAKAESVLGQLSQKRRIQFTQLDRDNYAETANQPDPLRSAKDLAKLDADSHQAKDPSEKAKILFAMATYYYSHRNLMLYNANLWDGDRAVLMGFSWNYNVSTPQDNRALETHHWEHECMAQAYLICREVVTKYPKSSVRYRAAYMAACAAERLSRLNPYWRWLSDHRDLELQAVHFMKIARRSQNRSLSAKATKYLRVFAETRYADRGAFESERRKERPGMPYRSEYNGEDDE